jgi:hypothetical protein
MAKDISARKLVEQIWEQVASEQALRPNPTAGLADYDRLVEDGERRYVNSRYVLHRAPVAGDAGLGRVKKKLRARAARFVVGVLGGYFEDEQEFLAHLVRLQNTITVHIDRLSGEVRQLEALLQMESERLRAADTILHARLEDRLRALEHELVGLRQLGGA